MERFNRERGLPPNTQFPRQSVGPVLRRILMIDQIGQGTAGHG